MEIFELLILVYVVVTAGAMVMTYREQRRSTQRSLVFNLIGYLACTIWPVVCAVFVVAMQRKPA